MRSAQEIAMNDARMRRARTPGGDMYPQGVQGLGFADFNQVGRLAEPHGFDFYRRPFEYRGFGADGFINPYGLGRTGLGTDPTTSVPTATPPVLTPAVLGSFAGAALGGGLVGHLAAGSMQGAITGAIANVGLLSVGTLLTRESNPGQAWLLFGGVAALSAYAVWRRRR